MSQSPFGETRTRIHVDHALIAADGHVVSPLVSWEHGEGVVLISPTMGRGMGGPRFSQYLVQGSATCKTTGSAEGIERLVYVLDGSAEIDGQSLGVDSFAWFPPGDCYSLVAPPDCLLLVFEKPYEAIAGVEAPPRQAGMLSEAPRQPFMGDPDAMLSTLLPTESAFDMAVNVFEYKPGATLPFVETHVMEHGLYMRSGQGVYRLGEQYYPVTKGDTIWMASYCPQWFVAMGKESASYIYYKDIHRDPLTTVDD